MLQNDDDVFEPDAAAHAAIQVLWPSASANRADTQDRGQLLSGEVKQTARALSPRNGQNESQQKAHHDHSREA